MKGEGVGCWAVMAVVHDVAAAAVKGVGQRQWQPQWWRVPSGEGSGGECWMVVPGDGSD